MKKQINWPKYLVIGFFAVGIIAMTLNSFLPGKDDIKDLELTDSGIALPSFSKEAMVGNQLFDMNCVACHGGNASGTEQGPPLIHRIYNPGHHSDRAFYLAVENGAKQHHWPFGDMPAQPQVSSEQVARIIHYIRELQEANGIAYQKHQM